MNNVIVNVNDVVTVVDNDDDDNAIFCMNISDWYFQCDSVLVNSYSCYLLMYCC